MKASNVAKALHLLIAAKRPGFIWGKPGVGKSNVMAQVAIAENMELRDIRAVLLDPVDLRGIPYKNGEGRTHWAIPEFLPRDGRGILFWDELNAAPALVQAACYQIILDRRLGDYILPEGWVCMAAGNRETDRAVTTRMPTPLANRFVHIDFEIDLNDWVTWALGAGIKTELIAFLRFRPALLHDFHPENGEKAFPTPRSWEFASNVLHANPDPDIEYEVLKGTVGEAATAELLSFLRIFRTLPNPDVVLMNPDAAPVPTDPATLYALTGALARKASDQTIDRIARYALRLPAEFNVMMVRDSLHYCPDVANTRAYIEWQSKNTNVMI